MILRASGPLWLLIPWLWACAGDDDGSKPSAHGCTEEVAPEEGFLPCEVEAVLRAKCQRCHDTLEALQPCLANDSCAAGPFPLLTFADTRRTFDDLVVYERMGRVVASGAMPYQLSTISPPVEPLTDAEKKTLLDWVADCAPSGSAACAP